MKFRGFSKDLSDQIENLFATIGGSSAPEDAHRLDEYAYVKDLIERAKNLDVKPTDDQKNPQ